MIIPHDLKCGTCGAAATHEQCGGALACDAHIGPGRAWLIDAKTIELVTQPSEGAQLEAPGSQP